MPEYARRDIIALDEAGGYYHRHVAAMTEEGLHSKRDIAAELAWRDQRIAELRKENKRLKDELGSTQHALMAGPEHAAARRHLASFAARCTIELGEKLNAASAENERLKSLLREALELLTSPRGGMGGGLVVPEFMRRVREALTGRKHG